MAITKRDIINGAFTELGLGAYNYDLQPEDYEDALSRLDSMMAEWSADNLQTGYPLDPRPDATTLDDEIGLIMPLKEGVVCSLAIRIAPAYGKSPSQDTKMTATRGWQLAQRLSANIPHKNINPHMAPAGAGNRRLHGYGYNNRLRDERESTVPQKDNYS